MTPTSPSTSSSLLMRAAAQEPGAWHRFAEIYGPLVYEWCRRAGLQPADAADVSQDTFATVAVKLSDFRRDRLGDSFRGWLWTVNRSKICDHFRRLRKHHPAKGGTGAQQELARIADPNCDDATSLGDCAEGGGLQYRALEFVRASVEPRTWQAFWRVAVDGQSAADVATELGLSVQAVYDAKYHIRRKIRQELGDLLD